MESDALIYKKARAAGTERPLAKILDDAANLRHAVTLERTIACSCRFLPAVGEHNH